MEGKEMIYKSERERKKKEKSEKEKCLFISVFETPTAHPLPASSYFYPFRTHI